MQLEIPGAVLAISSISIWEIAVKVRKGRLVFGMAVRDMLGRLHATEGFGIHPVDENLWLEAVELDWVHPDPADRVIVATAKRMNAPLLTPDREIAVFYPRTTW